MKLFVSPTTRGVTVVRISVTALALVAALSVSTAASAVPNQDSAVGTIERVTRAGFPTTVHVNATSGSQGEDARGVFWTTIEHPALGELTFRGHVTCLAVNGNRAAVRGTVDVSTDPDIAVGSEFQIEMTDNGSPGTGSDTTIGYFGFLAGEGCPDSFGLVPEVTIIDGNFTVNDS
jgi:hypothetical protein